MQAFYACTAPSFVFGPTPVTAAVMGRLASQLHMLAPFVAQGVAGHGFYDDCVVPIIENTARECELTDRLQVHSASTPLCTTPL